MAAGLQISSDIGRCGAELLMAAVMSVVAVVKVGYGASTSKQGFQTFSFSKRD